MNRFAFSRGFTIVELMVTVAIAAILLAVAVPSFTSFAQKRAVSQKTVQVRNALELARGLALSQRQILTVCTVNALNSCLVPVACVYWYFLILILAMVSTPVTTCIRILISTPY